MFLCLDNNIKLSLLVTSQRARDSWGAEW